MGSKFDQYCIAFYNLENLFDTEDDPRTLDDDFTEDSDRRWNEKRFRKKLKKLGRVISDIGYEDIGYAPVMVGVAEVENRFVLEELCRSKFLRKKNYGVVHLDSPDERGIDTALIYRKDHVEILESQAHTVHVVNELGIRDYTRDILEVKAALKDQVFHILVNHWPSRRKGVEETEFRRIAAADKAREVIDGIHLENPEARVIIMGDFNDDPFSNSIQRLKGNDIHNPTELLLTRDRGSANHRGDWHLFDQVLISNNFMRQHGNLFRFDKAAIYDPEEIQTHRGKLKGRPFRTYLGKYYAGGYSDHFPVYTLFSVSDE